MDREELALMISKGPVRVHMNNGDTFEIPNAEMALVGDFSAAVLVRSADGRLRHQYLSLFAICSVEEIGETADS